MTAEFPTSGPGGGVVNTTALWASRWTVGRWYSQAVGSSTSAPANGDLHYAAIWVPAGAKIDSLGIDLSTAGEAGALIRLGVYADNGSGYPGAVLLDAGTVGGGASGGIEDDIADWTFPSGGPFWLAALVFNAPTTRPAIRRAGTPIFPIQAGGTTILRATQGQNAGYVSGGNTSGAFPDPAPGGMNDISIPFKIAVKPAA